MGKGINVVSGFNVLSANPIDERNTKNTLAEMYAIKTVYDGLQCFCKETGKTYLYKNGAWDSNAFGASGLASDTKTINDYLIRS